MSEKETLTETISFRVSAEMRRQIERAAEKDNRKRGDIVRLIFLQGWAHRLKKGAV